MLPVAECAILVVDNRPEAVTDMPDAGAFHALRNQLHSDDPGRRAAAEEEVLAAFGGTAAAVLNESVVSDNPAVRAKAYETLLVMLLSGEEMLAELARDVVGSTRARQALAASISDPLSPVRESAEALSAALLAGGESQ